MEKTQQHENYKTATNTLTHTYTMKEESKNKRIKTVCKVTKQHVSVHKDDQTIRGIVDRLSRRNRTLLFLPPFLNTTMYVCM